MVRYLREAPLEQDYYSNKVPIRNQRVGTLLGAIRLGMIDLDGEDLKDLILTLVTATEKCKYHIHIRM